MLELEAGVEKDIYINQYRDIYRGRYKDRVGYTEIRKKFDLNTDRNRAKDKDRDRGTDRRGYRDRDSNKIRIRDWDRCSYQNLI